VFLASRRGRLVLGGAAVALAAVAAPLLAGRFLSGGLTDNVRTEIWGRALRVIADNPLLGVGLGNFGQHAQDVTLPRSAAPPPHAHDVALVAATEIGVPGALAIIGVIVILAVALVRAVPRLRGTDRQVALACCGAIAATAVGGAFDAVFIGNVQTLLLAATVAGLAAAVTARRPPRPTGAPGSDVAPAREPTAAAC
jgi:O-antigen ligase